MHLKYPNLPSPPLPLNPNRLFNQLGQVASTFLLAAGLAFAVGEADVASAKSSSTSASTEIGSSEISLVGMEEPSARWLANFDLQVARQLRKSTAEIRVDLLEVLIEQASKRENLKLPQTASALLHVVETSKSRGNRMMAVQALSEVGPAQVGEVRYGRAMNQLYALGQEETSDQVRGAIAEVVTNYQAG